MEHTIETESLTKKFGKHHVVQDVHLKVPTGSIFAFLGPNGAGKSTAMKMILNMMKADGGSSKVFNIPSSQLGPKQFHQIGYVSENQQILSWMTVEQFLDYCKSFYPSWDNEFCEGLLKQFDLPKQMHIKDLSRGMRMKLRLISSIAYRPSLLVLDEPFSSLDPLVREQVIKGILDLTENEHWTIFISTHDMEEVERLADHVGMIHHGRMIVMEEITELQNRFRKITLNANASLSDSIPLPSHWLSVEKGERLLSFIEEHFQPEKSEQEYRLRFPSISSVTASNMTLRDIFIALAKHHHIQGLEKE